MDLFLAVSHICASLASLPEAHDEDRLHGCAAVGVFNQIALFASNCWYVVLAFDLAKAIQNPFR